MPTHKEIFDSLATAMGFKSTAPKIGITGTRHGMTELQEVMLEGLLRPMSSFHHGSCQGVDVQAAQIVGRLFNYKPRIVCHPGPDGDPCQQDSGVDDERREPKTHFARNRDIVDETDELYACPREMEEQKHGGTWYTIRYARKKGKPVTIIFPDGSLGK